MKINILNKGDKVININEHFIFVEQDITKPIDYEGHVDYIIHAASNTHPLAYSNDPIGTITANVDGTRNLLDLANANEGSRFIFLSSVEIYGQNRGDVELFKDRDSCRWLVTSLVSARGMEECLQDWISLLALLVKTMYGGLRIRDGY